MNFLEVVKGLEEGKVYRREGWNQNPGEEDERLIKNEYGILQKIAFTYVNEYRVVDEDVLADDWVEIEKEKYVLKDLNEEKGLQYFTIGRNDSFFTTDNVFSRYEFKNMMKYLDIEYDEQYSEVIDSLMNPPLSDFDYHFRKCPICEESLLFQDSNVGKCSNGCVEYDVDPQGETVTVSLFDSELDDENFLVSLYKTGWSANDRDMVVDLQKFQEAILYWRENERYKKRKKK